MKKRILFALSITLAAISAVISPSAGTISEESFELLSKLEEKILQDIKTAEKLTGTEFEFIEKKLQDPSADEEDMALYRLYTMVDEATSFFPIAVAFPQDEFTILEYVFEHPHEDVREAGNFDEEYLYDLFTDDEGALKTMYSIEDKIDLIEWYLTGLEESFDYMEKETETEEVDSLVFLTDKIVKEFETQIENKTGGIYDEVYLWAMMTSITDAATYENYKDFEIEITTARKANSYQYEIFFIKRIYDVYNKLLDKKEMVYRCHLEKDSHTKSGYRFITDY